MAADGSGGGWRWRLAVVAAAGGGGGGGGGRWDATFLRCRFPATVAEARRSPEAAVVDALVIVDVTGCFSSSVRRRKKGSEIRKQCEHAAVLMM